MLLCAIHVAFWDGFVAELVSWRAGLAARAWMLASQLRRHPQLAWIGAFGAEEDARDGARALRHAARLLDRPGRAVWLFPQGRQRPQWARPLGFKGGAALLARRVPGAAVVPVALHYELGERERPEAWLRFGPPMAPGFSTDALEAAVELQLFELARAVLEGCDVPSLFALPRRLGEGPASRALARLVRSRP